MRQIMDKNWFTEIDEENGSAFSMSITEKLHEERTAFQHIEIYETVHFGTLMVIDGFVMLTDRDNFIYHEMMSHPVLFTHAAPENIAIIGGGDCGTLHEVLKHPGVKTVRQIDIDERVTRLSERYFPQLCETNDDPRAEFLFIDGIEWMSDTKAGSVDVIIVDSTDPVGPGEGLFTEAFYRSCLAALGEHGIMVQQSESPLYHMPILGPMRTAMRSAGFSSVLTLYFPQASYPSGWWSATMGGKNSSLETFRKDDAANKAFRTDYYNTGIHQAAMAEPEFVRRALQE